MGNNSESYQKLLDENMRLKIENMKQMDKIDALQGSADYWKAATTIEIKAKERLFEIIKKNQLEGM